MPQEDGLPNARPLPASPPHRGRARARRGGSGAAPGLPGLSPAAAISAIDEGVALLDASGRVMDVNERLAGLVGRRAEQLAGRPAWELGIWNDAAALRELLERFGRDAAQGAVGVQRCFGTAHAVVKAHPIRGGERHVGAVISVVDVTELVEARRRAERADQAKGELLAHVSHELRTPVNGIVGMVDLALEGAMPDEQREGLEMVRQSARSLVRILTDLLDFSRIQAGKLTLEPVDFDVRSCLAEPMRVLGIQAEEKGLEMLCRIAPGVPRRLVGDPNRLRQVLVNLVGNAVKFTAAGAVEVAAWPDSSGAAGVCLHVAVRDTGVGIPTDKQRVIFEPFEQVAAPTSGRHEGAGLGLPIARRLVEAMGGRIWVESAPGAGSTFHFTAVLQPTTDGEERVEEPAGPQTPSRGAVLVVDDHAGSRGLPTELLSAMGAGWCAVGGAGELETLAVAMSGGEPFGAVLIDGSLPEMEDFDLVARLARLPATASARTIVMLSSAGRRGQVARCVEMDLPYLVKPVLAEDLERVLRASVVRADRGAESGPADRPAGALRVLVAEDNRTRQRLLRDMLQRRGHAVATADDGADAVAMLRRQSFDLVLMDLQMPALGGLEATAVIRQEEQGSGRRVPIVAMAARPASQEVAQCLRAGMDGCLAKPVQPRALEAEIARVLAGETAPRAAGPAAQDAEAPQPAPEGLSARLQEALVGRDWQKLAEVARGVKQAGAARGAEAAIEAGEALDRAAAARDVAAVCDAAVRAETELARLADTAGAANKEAGKCAC